MLNIKREEIKEYFDKFYETNTINMPDYTYLNFLVYDFMNKNKVCNVISVDNNKSIMIYYICRNKIRFPLLPLIKETISVKEYGELLDKYIELIKNKFNVDKIMYIPKIFKELYEKKYKLYNLDKIYYFDIKDYVDLYGKEYKHIREEYNKFKRMYDTELSVITKDDISEINILLKEWNNKAKDRCFRILDTTANKNYLDIMFDDEVKKYNYKLVDKKDNKLIGIIGYYEIYPNSDNICCFIMKTRWEEYKFSTIYLIVETFKKLYNENYFRVDFTATSNSKGIEYFKNKLKPNDIYPVYYLKI